MDPRTPVTSEEEIIRDPATGQEVRKMTTNAPTQRVEQKSTINETAAGQTTLRSEAVGVSPEFAREYGQKKKLYHTYQILWYVLGLIEILLAFRFVLKMLGANPEAGFAQFVYSITVPFAGPFAGLFGASTSQGVETVAEFEWSTLVAAAVYALIAWGVVKLLQMGKPTDPGEVERTVESQ